MSEEKKLEQKKEMLEDELLKDVTGGVRFQRDARKAEQANASGKSKGMGLNKE